MTKKILGIILALLLTITFIILVKQGILEKNGVLPIGFLAGFIVAVAFDQKEGEGK